MPQTHGARKAVAQFVNQFLFRQLQQYRELAHIPKRRRKSTRRFNDACQGNNFYLSLAEPGWLQSRANLSAYAGVLPI
jgi:hypothetical protein